MKITDSLLAELALFKRPLTESFEDRYFIINRYLPVSTFASAVRNHWSIEAMHWTLDVTFREDSQQTSERTLANNLNWLRRFAISMLKRGQKKGESIVDEWKWLHTIRTYLSKSFVGNNLIVRWPCSFLIAR